MPTKPPSVAVLSSKLWTGNLVNFRTIWGGGNTRDLTCKHVQHVLHVQIVNDVITVLRRRSVQKSDLVVPEEISCHRFLWNRKIFLFQQGYHRMIPNHYNFLHIALHFDTLPFLKRCN